MPSSAPMQHAGRIRYACTYHRPAPAPSSLSLAGWLAMSGWGGLGGCLSSDEDYSEAFDDGVTPAPPSDEEEEPTLERSAFSLSSPPDGHQPPPSFSFKGFSAGAQSFSFAGPNTILASAADQAEHQESDDVCHRSHGPEPEPQLGPSVNTMAPSEAWRQANGPLQADLLAACEAGQAADVARYLEKDHADPNKPVTPSGLGPAHHAAMQGHTAVLAALCDAGADVNQSPHEISCGASVLQYAIQEYEYSPATSVAMTEILCLPQPKASGSEFASGPAASRVTNHVVLGEALSFACAWGSVPIVHILLRAGADAGYYPEHDDYAITPLVRLIFENEERPGHAEIARMLLTSGAARDHVARSKTALGYAEEYGRVDVVAVLREAGAERTS